MPDLRQDKLAWPRSRATSGCVTRRNGTRRRRVSAAEPTTPCGGLAVMSETPVERQTIVDKDRGGQPAPAEAVSRGPRSQSLQAGGQFVKALAADLGAVASRLRPKPRQPQPPSARPSSGPGIGRVFWRAGMVFLGVVLLCCGALSAAMLWVVFGSPFEPHRVDPA